MSAGTQTMLSKTHARAHKQRGVTTDGFLRAGFELHRPTQAAQGRQGADGGRVTKYCSNDYLHRIPKLLRQRSVLCWPGTERRNMQVQGSVFGTGKTWRDGSDATHERSQKGRSDVLPGTYDRHRKPQSYKPVPVCLTVRADSIILIVALGSTPNPATQYGQL